MATTKSPAKNKRSTHFWHPFANMAVVSGNETIIERGQGVWLWDSKKKRYLDATAGLWYCFVGHGRAELAEVAAAQIRKLAAYSAFGDLANEPAIQLAERVAELSPLPDAAVFFTSGGSESIDTAAKLVRRYWTALGQPKRQILVTREGSYHGVAGYGTSLAGIEANSAGYGELLPGVVCIPPDDPQALAATIDKYPGQVAAFFGEPVRGAGGVYPPIKDYWPEIQKICQERNILLVVDEVVTGFGRLGSWFASSRLGIVPDIITGAKGLTSGYLPLGVVIVGPRVQEPFWNAGGSMFRHGYTYSGHATACAIGLANLEIIEREHLLERVNILEPLLDSEMRRLLEHPLVGEVRSIGLTAAFQLTAEALAVAPALAETVLGAARDRGILSRSMLSHSIQISPPLVITEEEICSMTDGFISALDYAYGELTALEAVRAGDSFSGSNTRE